MTFSLVFTGKLFKFSVVLWISTYIWYYHFLSHNLACTLYQHKLCWGSQYSTAYNKLGEIEFSVLNVYSPILSLFYALSGLVAAAAYVEINAINFLSKCFPSYVFPAPRHSTDVHIVGRVCRVNEPS